MRRKSFAAAADDHSESPTEPIGRISAEHGSPTVTSGRHRRAGDGVGAPNPRRGRSGTRRLAPLAVGAAVMLVATTVATVVRGGDDTALAIPWLSTAIAPIDPTTVARRAAPTESPTPEQYQANRAAPELPSTTARTQQDQAAAAKGWTPSGGDEFNGEKSPDWTVYEGEGHAGIGRRTQDAVSVENGSLVIRGDGQGNSGGLAWSQDQRFGRWETRARFPKGDPQYHPVLLLWPEGSWPEGGEVNFAETDSAADSVWFFLHYRSRNQQTSATKAIDITQWHNYAVEWVDGRITGYIDGEQWFESTDGNAMPPGSMHPTIQLDYFPEGGSPRPTEMYVDYMRIYA